jgi:hypothetical protein
MTISTFADYLTLAKQERNLSDYRRQLHVAIDSGNPTELMLQRERAVSAERRALHRRLDALKAELWPPAQPRAQRTRLTWLRGR